MPSPGGRIRALGRSLNGCFGATRPVWSWYIRPLFLIPYGWAAWRHSGTGIALTLLALLTSMAWFPAPAVPDPQVAAFLAAERAFLSAPLTLQKLAMLALIPASLAALALACWRRSLGWALLVITLIAAGKILWSLAQDTSATRLLPPALLGLGLCWGAGLIWWWCTNGTKRHQEAKKSN